MNQHREWDIEDEETLKVWWNREMSVDEIANAMNRSKPSIYIRARKLGLPKRTNALTRQQRNKAWNVIESLAKEMNVKPHQIINQLQREWYGVKG